MAASITNTAETLINLHMSRTRFLANRNLSIKREKKNIKGSETDEKLKYVLK